MKKYWKEILLILVVVIAIGYIIVDSKRDIAYHFTGEYKGQYNDPEYLTVDVFVIRNGNGDLLTYNTNILYSETEIKGTRFYYLENDEKRILLGGSRLNLSDYSKKNANKREYGIDYFDIILDNTNNLYFDLCSDTECNDVSKTLKLKNNKLF